VRRMTRTDTALLLVGWQDRPLRVLAEAVRRAPLERALLLRQVADRLALPVICTELEPRHHGRVLPSFSGAAVLDHAAFSAAAGTDLIARLTAFHVRHVVLSGIETHTGVAQTALDLADADFDVLVVADACAATKPPLHDLALSRLQHAGVGVTSAEATIFEWVPEVRDPVHAELSRTMR